MPGPRQLALCVKREAPRPQLISASAFCLGFIRSYHHPHVDDTLPRRISPGKRCIPHPPKKNIFPILPKLSFSNSPKAKFFRSFALSLMTPNRSRYKSGFINLDFPVWPVDRPLDFSPVTRNLRSYSLHYLPPALHWWLFARVFRPSLDVSGC